MWRFRSFFASRTPTRYRKTETILTCVRLRDNDYTREYCWCSGRYSAKTLARATVAVVYPCAVKTKRLQTTGRPNINVISPPAPAAAAACGGYTCGGIGGRHRAHRRDGADGRQTVVQVDRDRPPAPATDIGASPMITGRKTITAMTGTTSNTTGKWVWRPRWCWGRIARPSGRSSMFPLIAVALLQLSLLTFTVKVTWNIIYFIYKYIQRSKYGFCFGIFLLTSLWLVKK